MDALHAAFTSHSNLVPDFGQTTYTSLMPSMEIMPVFSYEPEFSQQRELVRDLTWHSDSVPRLTSLKFETDSMDPCVPGQPLLPVSDEEKVLEFLARDLCHESLNRLVPIFWLLATQRSDHVSALHNQIVRGREIVITEDPGLHLLWYNNRVFIKPLPPYLTSHAFWKEFLCRENSAHTRKAALGFMRSYYHLLKCQSDFNVAKGKKLIDEEINFKALLRFLHSFASVSDDDVTARYNYGELRLSRINLYIKFYKFQLYYKKMHWQYSDYVGSLVAPFAFAFALISTALSAMQVVLGAQQFNENQTRAWRAFTAVSQWSAVAFLVLISICTLIFPLMVCTLLLRELVFALGGRRHGPDEEVHYEQELKQIYVENDLTTTFDAQ